MLEKSVELVAKKLEVLALKLGMSAEEIFAFTYKRVLVEGIVGCVLIILAISLLWWLKRDMWHWGSGIKEDGENVFTTMLFDDLTDLQQAGKGLFWVFAGCCIVGFLITGGIMSFNLTGVEFSALERILGLIK